MKKGVVYFFFTKVRFNTIKMGRFIVNIEERSDSDILLKGTLTLFIPHLGVPSLVKKTM